MHRFATRGLGAASAGVVATAVMVGGLTGCALKGSGYQYVRNSDTRTYFKVPEDWTVDTVPSEDEARLRWFVTFQATDRGGDEGDRPAGTAQVLELTPAAREGVSFDRLNRLYYPDFAEGLEAGTVAVERIDDVEDLEGFRGRRLVYTLQSEDGRVTVDQTTLLDDGTRNLYALMIRCTTECYDDNRSVIDEVVASLTVREQ